MKNKIDAVKLKELLKQNKTTDEIARYFGFEKTNYFRNRLAYLGISLFKIKLELTKELLDQGLKESELVEKLDIDRVTLYSRKKALKKLENENKELIEWLTK